MLFISLLPKPNKSPKPARGELVEPSTVLSVVARRAKSEGRRTKFLIFTNLRYLFFCFACFIALSNHSPLLAQDTGENIASIPKKMGTDEFKALVENIYDLLLQGHSADDIVKILETEKAGPYNIKKLVAHIYDLLNKQNSQNTIINIIVNNNGSKEYRARTNFLNILTNPATFYLALKIIAIILAVIVTCYVLARYFSGKSGFFNGAPQPKNRCSVKNLSKKSNDYELSNPDILPFDNAPQLIEKQEMHGHEISVQAAPKTLPGTHPTSQSCAPASEKTGPAIIQNQQSPSVICIKKIAVNDELMEEANRMVECAISLCPNFVKPPHVDIRGMRTIGEAAAKEPIDTRKLSEIIDESISEFNRLGEQLRK